MKVYLAAPYQMKDTINRRAKELRQRGIEITSQWLDESYKPEIQMIDISPKEHQYLALRDVADISEADVFVLQPDTTNTIIRQGRTAELGIAVGIGLSRPFPIFVIGRGEENIFHHMPQVYHFDTWDETRQRLIELAECEKAGAESYL